MAELRRLAVLFGGISDSGLTCAFLAGLPESARHVLRAGSRMEGMGIKELLDRARAVLAEDSLGAAAATQGFTQPTAAVTSTGGGEVRCLDCNQLNHYARDCLANRDYRRGGRSNVRRYKCRRRGHVAAFSLPSLKGVLPTVHIARCIARR